MPATRPWEGTFWKYSITAIQSGKPRDALFAAVKATQEGSKTKITAWELELRPWGVDHPLLGRIPFDYFNKIDLFCEAKNNKFPRKKFYVDDNNYYCLGTKITPQSL